MVGRAGCFKSCLLPGHHLLPPFCVNHKVRMDAREGMRKVVKVKSTKERMDGLRVK